MPFPPATYRAWQYTSTKGGLEKNLKINLETPLPTPNSTQHLVQIIAVALNPVDYKPAEVPIAGRLIVPKHATPGIDFAGSIITPAEGSQFKPGDLVFGALGTKPWAGGALAEFGLCESDHCALVPDGVDLVESATIGVAGLTAYQTIVPRVKSGDKIFINGGSGGTGCFGIQIAKAVGCFVATSCSTGNVELCKSLGADEVVDYKKGDVVDQLVATGHKFDHVVDNVGTDMKLYWRCHEYTKPEAVYIGVAGHPTLGHIFDMIKVKTWPGFLGGGKRKQEGFFTTPVYDEVVKLAAWMKEGKVKAVIDSKFAFEDAPKAFERLKTGRARGKVVVDVASQTYEKAQLK